MCACVSRARTGSGQVCTATSSPRSTSTGISPFRTFCSMCVRVRERVRVRARACACVCVRVSAASVRVAARTHTQTDRQTECWSSLRNTWCRVDWCAHASHSHAAGHCCSSSNMMHVHVVHSLASRGRHLVAAVCRLHTACMPARMQQPRAQ